MTVWQIIDSVLFKPLQILFEVIYMFADYIIDNPGFTIIVLSLVMNFLVLPLYRRADAIQEEERNIEARLHIGVSHIKKTFKGDEKMMILQTYYRQNNYKPTYVLKGAVSLFLEIPFFIAAYRFLSGLQLLNGVSFGPISDLGSPDGLLVIGTLSVNILPIIMTVVNLVSCIIFTKGAAPKTKIQLYAMAVFFLFFLYTSPSGLVFYWTLNNIFNLIKTICYKLKNPKKILSILSSVIGVFFLAFSIVKFNSLTELQKKFSIATGIVLLVPLIVYITKSKKQTELKNSVVPDRKIFICSGIYLSILVGLVIPLSVIKSNPAEFINTASYENPIIFAISSFCIAIGTFIVWFNVFYYIASPRGKQILNTVFVILCGVFTLDSMLFGNQLGNMSASLRYDDGISFTITEICINIACIIGVSVLLYFLHRIINKHMFKVLATVTLAIIILVPIDIININNSLGDTEENISATSQMPSYSLSKNGKNVILFMLDRGLGDFVPIIFNEKGDRPDLIKKFDGFTAYTNVISYGTSTNLSSPSLFGGYDYTPENINKRDNEKLVDKHNEALKVLPTLFEKNGYKITISDPTYANYQWFPDISIYEGTDWKIYISKAKFPNIEYNNRVRNNNFRNFFCYSIMKSAPVTLQNTLYDRGRYYNSSVLNGEYTEYEGVQEVETISKAKGIDISFEEGYQVLVHMSEITKIENSNDNTFLMMTNDTTHEPIILQEPEFEPRNVVDNTEYDNAHKDRFKLSDNKIEVNNSDQMQHYQTNVASYLELSKWFDYLREQGVYDNTRIILVSDHGRKLGLNKENKLTDNNETSVYHPILFIKDFNSKGFSISSEFMTLADVPSLTLRGIEDDAVNPFTGNSLRQDDVKEQPIYLNGSFEYSVNKNNGNQFIKSNWIKFTGKDITKRENWSNQPKETVLPIK